MPTLTELHEQSGTLVTQARAALEEINTNTDTARAAELDQRHDTIMQELDTLTAKIARETRVAAAERAQDDLRETALRNRRPPHEVTEARAADTGGAVSYRSAFHAYLRSHLEGAEPLTGEQRAVLRAGYEPMPAEQRAQTTLTGASGGYTVPTDMLALLIRSMLMYGPMYDPDVAYELNSAHGHTTQIPTVNDTGRTLVPAVQGVAMATTGADTVFGQKTIGAWSYGTNWLPVSRELAEDSIFAVESLLASLLGEGLGRFANLKLTVGVGTTEPLGIVTGASAGVTAASSTAIASDELFDLAHSVDPAYRGSDKFQWMFNDQTFKYIRKLKDGQGRYLWQMADIRGSAPATLLDHRYRINQAMAGVATTNKSVLIGDFNKFMVRKIGAPLIGAIQDKDFWPGYGMAGYIRFDSQVLDGAAIKVLQHP